MTSFLFHVQLIVLFITLITYFLGYMTVEFGIGMAVTTVLIFGISVILELVNERESDEQSNLRDL